MPRTVASVAAALLFFLVTWIIATAEPKLLVSAQMAAAVTFEVAGLIVAVIGVVGLVLAALLAERAAGLIVWVLVFLAGMLMREPHWALALAFALVALALTAGNWWPRRPAAPGPTMPV